MVNTLLMVLLPFILFVLTISFGIFTKKVLHLSNQNVFIIGLISLFSSLFIISAPFLLFDLNFSLLVNIILFLSFISLVIATIYIVGNYKIIIKKIKYKFNKLKSNKYYCFLLIVVFLVILFQIIYVVYFQHTDIDDSYYLAQVNTYLETNKLHGIDPASGISSLKESNAYILVSFEILFAVIGKVFSINIAYFAHTIWPIYAIVCHYIVIFILANRLNSKFSLEFCLVYEFLNIFAGWSLYSEGAFLLNRIWQGKAVFATIFIPILYLSFLELYDTELSFSKVIYLSLILLAGISTTTVAIYLYPIMYFCFWLSKLLVSRKITDSIIMCIPILFLLPWVFIKLKLLMKPTGAGRSLPNSVAEGANNLSYIGQFVNRFLNNNWVIILLLILSFIIILFRESNKVKSVTFYPVVILLLTFANPLFVKFVAGYITGADVYWRIFWLIGIPIVYSVSIMSVISSFTSKKVGTVCLIASLVFISFIGTPVFKVSGWGTRENKYKLDARTVSIVDAIHKNSNSSKKNMLLLPEEISYGVREYCGDIPILINRYSSGTFYNNGKEKEYNRLMDNLCVPIYRNGIWDNNLVKNEIEHFKINYIVFYTASANTNGVPDCLEYICQVGQFSLYKYIK